MYNTMNTSIDTPHVEPSTVRTRSPYERIEASRCCTMPMQWKMMQTPAAQKTHIITVKAEPTAMPESE